MNNIKEIVSSEQAQESLKNQTQCNNCNQNNIWYDRTISKSSVSKVIKEVLVWSNACSKTQLLKEEQ